MHNMLSDDLDQLIEDLGEAQNLAYEVKQMIEKKLYLPAFAHIQKLHEHITFMLDAAQGHHDDEET